MDRDRTIRDILRWAESDTNLRAVVLAGSSARPEGLVDQFSDLDIEVYDADPEPLLTDHLWCRQFGDVLAVEVLENPGWHPTRLVYMVDAKIDFMVGDLASCEGVRDRPFIVLLDRDGLTSGLRRGTSPARPPSADEFVECVNWFSAALLMEAKLVVRGDLWHAKYREFEAMGQLLRMLEWDHRARHGWDYDTWYYGKHLSDWADPELRTAAEGCWSGYDQDGMSAAVINALEFFPVVADRVGLAIAALPFDHGAVSAEVRRILASGATAV